jgi:hypothetical protein
MQGILTLKNRPQQPLLVRINTLKKQHALKTLTNP